MVDLHNGCLVKYSHTQWCQTGKTGTTSSSIDSPLTINLHQYPVYSISNHPNSTSLGYNLHLKHQLKRNIDYK